MSKGIGSACAIAIVAFACSAAANAADKIKIGFFATLEGTYTALGEDGQRGFDLALMQHHNKAGGKEIEVIRGLRTPPLIQLFARQRSSLNKIKWIS